MRKLLSIVLGIILSVGIISTVRAEQSATGYENPPRTGNYQVFVVAYNSSPGTIARDNVVILDNSANVTATPLNTANIGSYVTTTNATDSVFVFGVTDEAIASGTMGRICVRGPHKAVSISSNTAATGSIISASTVPGKFGFYATADGTTGARLGYTLTNTVTADTGDASNTYWVWVNPEVHK